MKKIKLTKELLKDHYLCKKESISTVANLVGCCSCTIRKYMRLYNLKIRTCTEAQLGQTPKNKLYISKSFLEKEYIQHQRYATDIANQLGCCSLTINNYLRSYDIPVRSSGYWKNKKRSQAYKNKVKETMKGRPGKSHTIATKLKLKKTHLGMKYSNEVIVRRMRKVFKANKSKGPNKPEMKLSNLLACTFPKEYRYVGNYKVMIERYCPDFVSIQGKKVIELFGNYWHTRLEVVKRDKRRRRVYKSCGYKLLIVWESELQNVPKLVSKLTKFNI